MGKRITIKRIIAFFLSVSVFLFAFYSTYAFDTAKEHNQLMRDILFGNYSISNKDGNNKLKALECASYLCLDQYNGGGKSELSFLNNTYKVKGIIKDISKINFSMNSYHRRYTHRGWDFKYPDDRAHWNLRKEIMLKTVKKVFDYKDTKKCDAMSSTLYYIHILGDYFDMDENRYETYKNNNNKDPLLIELYSDTINNDSLLKLLKQNFISLFSFQKNNNAYSSLINFEFAEIENDLKYSNDYKSFKATCDKLENALKKYVPELMRDNNEFRNAFYMR